MINCYYFVSLHENKAYETEVFYKLWHELG